MQDKNVTVFGKDFDLSSDDFKDVQTLTDLEKLELFDGLEDPEKPGDLTIIREAESNLFNYLYAYQHNVDGDAPNVMTPELTVNPGKRKGKKADKPAE